MATPCCSQIDVVTGGADWKADVRIEDDDVRHCSLSTKKEQACRVDVSLTTVFISGVVVLEVLLVLVTMAVLIGGADWKANVRIEDDNVRHCSLSIEKGTGKQSMFHSRYSFQVILLDCPQLSLLLQ